MQKEVWLNPYKISKLFRSTSECSKRVFENEIHTSPPQVYDKNERKKVKNDGQLKIN